MFDPVGTVVFVVIEVSWTHGRWTFYIPVGLMWCQNIHRAQRIMSERRKSYERTHVRFKIHKAKTY